MEKVWKKTEISTEFEQEITVCPTEEYDGILLSFNEVDGKSEGQTLYLDKKTMEALISTMRDMMNYVLEK
jgi:hypothetical protein